MGVPSNQREQAFAEPGRRIDVRETVMMNDYMLAKQLAGEHIGQIEELTATAGQRQIQNGVAPPEAAGKVPQGLDQLLRKPPGSGVLGCPIEHLNRHSGFQELQHHRADTRKPMHRRGQWSDECDTACHPPCLNETPVGGRPISLPTRRVCRAPSFTDSIADARPNARNAATVNPIAIIKDPRMTIIKSTDAYVASGKAIHFPRRTASALRPSQ